MTAFMIAAVVALVVAAAILARPSDAELHQAAEAERLRRMVERRRGAERGSR